MQEKTYLLIPEEDVAGFARKTFPERGQKGTGIKKERNPWKVGEKYFIRTVTHHYSGLLVAVYPKELVLEKAAWIADDGRFMDCIRYGKLNEVEPFNKDDEVIIGRGAVLDATVWRHDLPIEQK